MSDTKEVNEKKNNKQATNQTKEQATDQETKNEKRKAVMQFVGGVAAFLVGMVVMYNTGLLLPLGAAGLLVAGGVK